MKKLDKYFTSVLCDLVVGDQLVIMNTLFLGDKALLTAPEEHYVDTICGAALRIAEELLGQSHLFPEGELDIDMQQVDLRGRVTGLEALVRWNHPRRGEIAPAYFVPIAEQSGLISELGMFTLRRAFEDSKRWPGVRIAVNVSANQLRDRNFAGDLAALVAEQAVRPENFDLEITESILLGDDPDTQGRLRELRDMGFCLALDDFGTGYSSLSYLHRYPIGKIKIDRSFIANLGVEVEASAVVDAIVRLAKALGLGVTAEGVETPAQFAHLRRARTIELQGFLFSRPVAATDVAALLGQALAPPPADTEPRLAG